MKGLGSPVKRAKVLEHLKSLQPDIIFLHGNSCQTRRTNSFVCKMAWAGISSELWGQGKRSGFRKNISFTISSSAIDPNGRYIILDGLLCSTPVILINVYRPNIDCPEFFS